MCKKCVVESYYKDQWPEKIIYAVSAILSGNCSEVCVGELFYSGCIAERYQHENEGDLFFGLDGIDEIKQYEAKALVERDILRIVTRIFDVAENNMTKDEIEHTSMQAVFSAFRSQHKNMEDKIESRRSACVEYQEAFAA